MHALQRLCKFAQLHLTALHAGSQANKHHALDMGCFKAGRGVGGMAAWEVMRAVLRHACWAWRDMRDAQTLRCPSTALRHQAAAMSKRGLSADEKKKRLLEVFHESSDASLGDRKRPAAF